jgi:hypothetical protein
LALAEVEDSKVRTAKGERMWTTRIEEMTDIAECRLRGKLSPSRLIELHDPIEAIAVVC